MAIHTSIQAYLPPSFALRSLFSLEPTSSDALSVLLCILTWHTSGSHTSWLDEDPSHANTLGGLVGHARSGSYSYHSRRRLTNTTTPIFPLADDVCSGRPCPPFRLIPSLHPLPPLLRSLTSSARWLSNPSGETRAEIEHTQKKDTCPWEKHGEQHVTMKIYDGTMMNQCTHGWLTTSLSQARTSHRASGSWCPSRGRCSRRPTS